MGHRQGPICDGEVRQVFFLAIEVWGVDGALPREYSGSRNKGVGSRRGEGGGTPTEGPDQGRNVLCGGGFYKTIEFAQIVEKHCMAKLIKIYGDLVL